MRRVFRYLQIDAGPRCSPSARPEIFEKKRILIAQQAQHLERDEPAAGGLTLAASQPEEGLCKVAPTDIVMACILMACMHMAYIVTASILMAYMSTGYADMACILMA